MPNIYRCADTGARAPQQIAWAVTTATPLECTGAPLYFLSPGIVESYAQGLYAKANTRPYAELIDFPGTIDLPPDCTVIAAGWHQLESMATHALRHGARLHQRPGCVRSPFERAGSLIDGECGDE